MKEPLRIEVEPLSDQRWARIERSLMDRVASETDKVAGLPTRSSRRLGVRAWLAAAAMVAALVVLVFAVRQSPEHAAVDHPSRITTGKNPSHLALPGLALEVQPESAVVVGAETPQGQLIVLDGGSILCQVAPRQSDAPLIVQAGGVRVRVVGTRFSVTRLGESARVKVYEGVVEVSSASESVRLEAGEEWPARMVQNPVAEPVPSTSAEPGSKAAATRLPAIETLGEKAATTKGTNATSAAGERRAQSATPADSTRRRSSQEVFEEATALEQSDPSRASRLYRKLESGTDSWAQNALYARGRLEASRGNPAEARRLLERYLERFPGGSNAEDARAVLRRLR